eukprot:scaffold82830_cov67-Phaeocystis_antarctica.AAC.1
MWHVCACVCTACARRVRVDGACTAHTHEPCTCVCMCMRITSLRWVLTTTCCVRRTTHLVVVGRLVVGADDGDGQREDEDAREHGGHRDDLADARGRIHVAVADGGHRHDAPPHGRGDGGELLLLRKALVVRVVGVLGAAELCVVHHAAEDDHRDHHEEEDGHELRG